MENEVAIANAAMEAFWTDEVEDVPPSVALALMSVLNNVLPEEHYKERRGMRPGGTGAVTSDEFKQEQRRETRKRFIAVIKQLAAMKDPKREALPDEVLLSD